MHSARFELSLYDNDVADGIPRMTAERDSYPRLPVYPISYNDARHLMMWGTHPHTLGVVWLFLGGVWGVVSTYCWRGGGT